MNTDRMIVVTGIDYQLVKTNENHMAVVYRSEDAEYLVEGDVPDDAYMHRRREVIRGRLHQKGDGETIYIGLTNEVAKILGLEFATYDALVLARDKATAILTHERQQANKVHETLLRTESELERARKYLRYYRGASLRERVKWLFRRPRK